MADHAGYSQEYFDLDNEDVMFSPTWPGYGLS